MTAEVLFRNGGVHGATGSKDHEKVPPQKRRSASLHAAVSRLRARLPEDGKNTKHGTYLETKFERVVVALFVGMLLFVGAGTGVAAEAAKFVHPGMLHNREELDFVKAKVMAGEEPWKTAWDELSKSPYAKLTWKARPTADVVRDLKFWRGAHELGEDGLAAYTQALQWVITGDAAHARKAAEILNAWSHTLKSITGHDAKLLGGITGYKFCNAAEILRHTGADWPEAEQEQFRQMMKGVYYPLIHDFFPKANGNWDASMIVTTMSIGIFCDDREIYDRAVDYALHSESHGALEHYVYPSGQCQESTRDQSHTQLGLGFLGDACETAWKQGQDLWGAYDNRLAVGFEYTARYNLGLDVPAEGKISEEGRGRFRPVYEKVYHHYHDRRGLEMKYTKEVIDKIRPEPPHWDHIPWGTLMFADLPADLRRGK